MFTAGLLAPWSQASCAHLQDSLSFKLGAPFIAKAIVTLHWRNAGPARKPCHELRHKVRGVTLLNRLSKEAAERWRRQNLVWSCRAFYFCCQIALQMRPTLAPFQRACVTCAASPRHKFLNLHRWLCICAALSSHRGLDKHATLRRRWKAACLCLVSLPVFCFFAPQLDWHGLSNNMAGRQYESLPGFYPLKWFPVTCLIFLRGFFFHLLFLCIYFFLCSKPRLIMILKGECDSHWNAVLLEARSK